MGKNNYKGDSKDTIIAIVGPTGSGKTRFINTLLGQAEPEALSASRLKPDTKDVVPYIIPYNGPTQLPGRLVLVDTPGLNEASRPDAKMLRRILDKLKTKYLSGGTLKLYGVIYFHRITDNRMPGSVFKDPQMFGRLCADVPLCRARLVTTMWDVAKDVETVGKRETQLVTDFWRKLIDGGAIARRFNNTQMCAWQIVEDLISREQSGEADVKNFLDQ